VGYSSPMPDPTRRILTAALEAVTLIDAFTGAATFEDYVADDLLKSAVERQFQRLGLAFAMLTRHDAATATAIPGLEDFVALSRELGERLEDVDAGHLWGLRESELPALAGLLRHLLGSRP
jgi:uncharacterized protein with HEPN domain